MRNILRRPLRVSGRLSWLAGEIVLVATAFVFQVLLRSKGSSLNARARWLQGGCRRVLRIFRTQVRVEGPIPRSGLLVSNHLSYLDILVFSSLTPSIFVAKRDVRSWPVFGWFARLGGTLFADRERRTQVGPLTQEIQSVLNDGALVILFPEGTSSDGRTVLPFKSALLEAATKCSHPLAACFIEYQLDDGDAGEEVCYWKDMTFGPHLLNLLSKKQVAVSVRFSQPLAGGADRKELAQRLHAEVVRLKGNASANPLQNR
jgi:1-acyl-sn-glycerol-3-phosphate acyltransferase